MTSILALDTAVHTGWAAYHGGAVTFGLWQCLSPDLGQFLAEWEKWLRRKIEGLGRPAIAFETPWVGPNTHQHTARKLMSMAGVTEKVAHQMGLNCFEEGTGTILKHFTGSGGGKRAEKKARVIAACRQRGLNPANDDEADAIALLDYAAHKLGVRTGIPDGPLFAGAA